VASNAGPPAAPDPNTSVTSHYEMQLTHAYRKAVPNIGNYIDCSSVACVSNPATPDPANCITFSGFGIFHDHISGLKTEVDRNLMGAVPYVLTIGDDMSLESLSASSALAKTYDAKVEFPCLEF